MAASAFNASDARNVLDQVLKAWTASNDPHQVAGVKLTTRLEATSCLMTYQIGNVTTTSEAGTFEAHVAMGCSDRPEGDQSPADVVRTKGQMQLRSHMFLVKSLSGGGWEITDL